MQPAAEQQHKVQLAAQSSKHGAGSLWRPSQEGHSAKLAACCMWRRPPGERHGAFAVTVELGRGDYSIFAEPKLHLAHSHICGHLEDFLRHAICCKSHAVNLVHSLAMDDPLLTA